MRAAGLKGNIMSTSRSSSKIAIMALAISVAAPTPARAEPVTFEALIQPKSDYTLEFADGSRHIVRLVQREGATSGGGPLAGARMLEVGLHDLPMQTGRGSGLGYLVFTAVDGDMAYLKFDWRALAALPGSGGPTQPLLRGSWEVVGGTGKFKAMTGLGTLHIDMVSPAERRWVFTGDLLSAGR